MMATVMAACCCLVWAAGEPVAPNPFVAAVVVTNAAGMPGVLDVTGPCLQNMSDASVTIVWHTSRKCFGWVEYGAPGAATNIAWSSHHGLKDANQNIHKIGLAGLKPGTHYAYRIRSREITDFLPYQVVYGMSVAGDENGFTTFSPAMTSVTFVVMNDIHENIDQMARVIKVAGGKPFDLVFMNGDIMSHLESERQVLTRCIGPASQLFAQQVPLFYARGNHETRGAFARMLGNYLDLPGGTFYYSFDCGPVHFTVLDCGEDKVDSHWAYSGLTDFDRYRDEERVWLEREVASPAFTAAAYRVVVSHMPFDGRTNNYTIMECKKKFGPLLERGKVDIQISGHTHHRAQLEAVAGERSHAIIIGGSPEPGESTVIRGEATGSNLTVTVLGDKGDLLDTVVIPQRR